MLKKQFQTLIYLTTAPLVFISTISGISSENFQYY